MITAIIYFTIENFKKKVVLTNFKFVKKYNCHKFN